MTCGSELGLGIELGLGPQKGEYLLGVSQLSRRRWTRRDHTRQRAGVPNEKKKHLGIDALVHSPTAHPILTFFSASPPGLARFCLSTRRSQQERRHGLAITGNNMLYYEKQFNILQIMTQKRTCRRHVPFDRGNKVRAKNASALSQT